MKSGSTVGLVAVGLVVLAGGALIGYYTLGGSATRQTAQIPVAGPAPASVSTPPPTPPAENRRPSATGGEYTAPGAPDIQIQETKVAPKPKPKPVPAPVDSEASQTGVANPQIGAAADGLNGAPAGNGSDDSDQSNTGSNDMGGGQNTAPQNNGSGADGYNAASPYASGKSVAIPKPAPTAQTFGSAVYRIQAGAFQSQANAKTLEDALRHKGYAATTMPRQSNGATSYVVQVGAYSSRVTADETVASLQHDGFPASVSVGQ